MNTKIQEVFSNEEFVMSLLEMETAEEVQAAVDAQGIELTLEEINEIRNHIMGTLTLDDLDNVAGGRASFEERVAGTLAIINNVFENMNVLGDRVNGWTGGRW